jgi:hypothetical protein
VFRDYKPNTIFEVFEVDLRKLISRIHVAFYEGRFLVTELLANLQLVVLVLVKLEYFGLHAPANDLGVVFEGAIRRFFQSKFEYTFKKGVCKELSIFQGAIVGVTFVFLDTDAFI